MTLIEKIIKHMISEKYSISQKSGEKNIVYIEGFNSDGTANSDEPNKFNDLRLVFGFKNTVPTIEGAWEATTEPGYYYTDNPMNPNGAARIAFGQYEAWQVGIHGVADPHEALVQVDSVLVYRDWNRDMIRSGDAIDEGYFGINQHWGGDAPNYDIGAWSAGCLVGRTRSGHEAFMDSIKSDVRYVADSEFIFTTTVIPGDKL